MVVIFWVCANRACVFWSNIFYFRDKLLTDEARAYFKEVSWSIEQFHIFSSCKNRWLTSFYDSETLLNWLVRARRYAKRFLPVFQEGLLPRYWSQCARVHPVCENSWLIIWNTAEYIQIIAHRLSHEVRNPLNSGQGLANQGIPHLRSTWWSSGKLFVERSPTL